MQHSNHPEPPLTDAIAPLGRLEIFKSYRRSPYLSIKHTSYFPVYEELFESRRHKPITFVEIGVLNGGSLFMWRDFLGPEARIIGIDFNPGARIWEKYGFEIHVGDQADPGFWTRFFEQVGRVDVVLDDGGHTFEQQIVTAHHCIPNIVDGGVLVVEDTHTSYFGEFGYPTKHSFIEWSKKIADEINARFPRVPKSAHNYRQHVYSITFYESIVCFKVNRRLCFESSPTSNDGQALHAADYRHHGTSIEPLKMAVSWVGKTFGFVRKSALAQSAKRGLLRRYTAFVARRRLRGLSRYF